MTPDGVVEPRVAAMGSMWTFSGRLRLVPYAGLSRVRAEPPCTDPYARWCGTRGWLLLVSHGDPIRSCVFVALSRSSADQDTKIREGHILGQIGNQGRKTNDPKTIVNLQIR
jgi:hypothetical protein